MVVKEIEEVEIYARTTATTAAAPATKYEAALALAAPVYLAIGPEPVAVPFTPVADESQADQLPVAPVPVAVAGVEVLAPVESAGTLVEVTTPLVYE